MSSVYDEVKKEKSQWDEKARTIQDEVELRGHLKNPVKQVNKSRRTIYKTFEKSGKRNLLLDVGCGNGLFTAPLVDLFNFVVGVDFSKEMIKHCKEKRDNIDFIVASATDLPLKDKVFDAIMSVSVLQHIRPKSAVEKVLREMSRVTTNDSYGFLTFWNEPNSPANFVKNILKEEKFEVKQSLISKFQFTGLNFTKYVKLYCSRSQH